MTPLDSYEWTDEDGVWARLRGTHLTVTGHPTLRHENGLVELRVTLTPDALAALHVITLTPDMLAALRRGDGPYRLVDNFGDTSKRQVPDADA